MLYTLSNVENKSADWKVADLKGIDGTVGYKVSINRKSKEGQVQFPTFDTFVDGAQADGNLWSSPDKTKNALYPNREPKVASGGNSGGFKGGSGVKAAQERKGEMIEKAQDHKEKGIKAASAMRAATDLAIAEWAGQPFPTTEQMEESIKMWRDIYLKIWDETEKKLDIPF